MSEAAALRPVAWWREPTRDQWVAFVAALLGWVLDVFDFAVFLLVMPPIAKEFGVSLPAVALIVSATLWLRLIGAVISGWFADRVGRKAPLLVSVLVYSLANFAAGLSPSYLLLILFRGIFGLGMGAEWPVGAALAMESWPARSRGLMGSVLQASSNIGFVLASVAYGTLFPTIGWRGLLMLGVVPAIFVIIVRLFIREPAAWVESRKRQLAEKQTTKLPIVSIFLPGMLGNTLNAIWWIISSFVLYYSITSLFATHLQKDLGLSPALVATPLIIANLLTFFASMCWGAFADRFGRRWAMIFPALIGVLVAPIYLLSHNLTVITLGYMVQGLFGMTVSAQQPAFLSERFPTRVRATAAGFVQHLGAFVGGFVPLVITFVATSYKISFAIPMLAATVLAALSVVASLLCGPETKGAVMDPAAEPIE